jgi:hypothetical protein
VLTKLISQTLSETKFVSTLILGLGLEFTYLQTYDYLNKDEELQYEKVNKGRQHS